MHRSLPCLTDFQPAIQSLLAKNKHTQTLVEVAYVTIQVVLYTVPTYFMIQLEASAGLFFYMLALVWLSCVVQFVTAQALVHITPNTYIATTLLSVLSILQGLVGGFTRPLPAAHKVGGDAHAFYLLIGTTTESV